FKEVEFDILFNEGISKYGELIDLATEHGIIQKSGSWFTYNGDRFQGRDQFKTKLMEDPKLANELEQKVREKLGLIKPQEQATEETPKKPKSEKSK
ncbi:MAG: DNA recombination/repair protein RecA, partial [Ignavibacteria bacterium]|nr:DNA recombination/repair protein RecA [Ignavibacteria bacterium]